VLDPAIHREIASAARLTGSSGPRSISSPSALWSMKRSG